jgi:hypothetical protein
LTTKIKLNLQTLASRQFATEMMAAQRVNKAPSPYLAAIVEQAERSAARLEDPGNTTQSPFRR